MTGRYWAALAAGCAIVGVMLFSTFAHASNCVPFGTARDNLLKNFGESPAFAGELSSGGALGLFTNPTTGTWTMIVQPDADTACLVTAGKGWMAMPATSASPPVEDHPAVPKMREYQDGNGRSFYLVPVRR